MKKSLQTLFLFIIVSVYSIAQLAPVSSSSIINAEAFRNPTSNVKVHTWWHWLDGAITKDGITKDLESMKQQGIVQATILNVGLFDEKNFGVKRVVFDSPEWHELFLWAMKEARRLDIKLGAHNCDGWSTSGGPWITPEMSMKQFVWTKKSIKGGKSLNIKLETPYSEKNFYKDVVVLAYQNHQTENSFQKAKPTIILNNNVVGNLLSDGNPSSAVALKKGDKISITFDKNFKTNQIIIHPRKRFVWEDMDKFTSSFILSSSIDGKNFRPIKTISLLGLNHSFSTEIPHSEAKYFQLETTEFSDLSGYLDFTIAEVELLQQNETPAYTTTVPYLLEKSVAVKAPNRNRFDGSVSTLATKGIDEKQIINLTDKMTSDGKLKWKAPKGNWTILRFGYTTTGVTNSPATLEGRGLECDKMDSTTLNFHFDSFSKKLITNAGEYVGNTFKFLLIDSWECGYQNWTANLPNAFEKNRGYNMINWIPVLCGETVGNTEMSEAFLYDFRKTIADLLENNYYKHFRDLCHRNKMEMHAEVIYGDANYPPLDILKTNSYADMPMFEFWSGNNSNGFTEYQASKPFESYPVFAANAYQQPVVGSEAYTGFTHYGESPSGLKIYGDRAFCSGINQMILHSYVHQPLDKAPGMTLGTYASHFNRNNPYWNQISEWLNYQSRIQSILQKGAIASNILYYIGDQLPQYIDNELVNQLPFGYRGMACNYDILMNKATVKNGKIVLENGIEYALLILPISDAMELNTLLRIEELVKQGATVLGKKPTKQLSMTGIISNKGQFDAMVAKIWGDSNENKYGKGLVINNMPIGEVLVKCNIVPEFKTNAADALNLMYIHKKQGETDIYFVANQRDTTFNRECAFAVGNKTAHILNPVDGSISELKNCTVENGMLKLPVTFKPLESMIFIFENKKADVTDNIKKTETVIKQPEVFKIDKLEATLQFLPAYEANILPIKTTELKSLTAFDEPQIKYFAGTVNYQIKFSLPDNYVNSTADFLLDIGQFDSTAELLLNGNKLGIVWLPGTKIKINGMLKKENVLEAKLNTVFRNRIIGDYIQYGKLQNVWTSAPVENFLSKDKPLKPSGWMGPISIITQYNYCH